MKFLILLFLLTQMALAQDFKQEAPKVAESLKKNLMGNLQRELKENGTLKAIDFCHTEVTKLGSKTNQEFKGKYQFGRTSHKIRNSKNEPQDWILPYLEKFQNKKQTDEGTASFYHKTKQGELIYVEPLWTAPMCLQCHGDNISKNVKTELLKRYPTDKAQNFKVGDFRGFIWVKEK